VKKGLALTDRASHLCIAVSLELSKCPVFMWRAESPQEKCTYTLMKKSSFKAVQRRKTAASKAVEAPD